MNVALQAASLDLLEQGLVRYLMGIGAGCRSLIAQENSSGATLPIRA